MIDQFFGLLACRSKVEREARNLEKRAVIESDYHKDETFAPKINKSSKRSRSRSGMSQSKYGEMLSKRSDSKALKTEIIRAENIEREMAECTFTPIIDIASRSASGFRYDVQSMRTMGYRPPSDLNQNKIRTARFKFINLDATAAKS